jgi:hypothetical protein
VVVVNGQPMIDFTPGREVVGYNFTYADPDDPVGVSYDVRWAVITQAPGGSVSSKRFILGVSQSGGTSFLPPVTLDTVVEK